MNLNNPNLDFDLEEAILKADLLRAQGMQNQEKDTLLGYGGLVAPWEAGTSIGNSLNQFSGRTRERGAEDSMRGLSNEQRNRYNALQSQLAPSTPVNMNDPNAIIAENARIQQLASQMSRLPMAREQAKMLQQTTSKFPQSMMSKAQGQDNLRDMQEDRQQYGVDTAITAQGYDQDNKRLGTDEKIRFEQWKLDNIPNYGQKTKGKGKTATGGQISDQADLRKSLAKNAEMLRSIFTYEEGVGYEPTTEGVSSLIASVVGDKAKYLGMDKTAEGVNQLDNLKGKVTSLAKELMSESGKLGNMAVQEWAIITDAIAKLDPLTDNFDQVLAEIKTVINESYGRNVQEYADKYGISIEEAKTQLGTPETEARRTMADRERFAQEAEARRTGKPEESAEVTVLETRKTKDGRTLEKLSDGTIRVAK